MKPNNLKDLEIQLNRLFEDERENLSEIVDKLSEYVDLAIKEVEDLKIRKVSFIKAWEFIEKIDGFLNKNPDIEKIIQDELGESKWINLKYRKAVLLFEHKKKYREAERLFEELVKQPEIKNRAYYYLGLISINRGEMSRTEEIFNYLKSQAEKGNLSEAELQMLENLYQLLEKEKQKKTVFLITNENSGTPELKSKQEIDYESLIENYDLFVDYEKERIFIKGKPVAVRKKNGFEIILCMALRDCKRKNLADKEVYEQDPETVEEERAIKNKVYKRIQRLTKLLKEHGIQISDFKINSSFCVYISKDSLENFRESII
ncbi:tetratricopeptide repeat protein [Persephonella atlantica]|uniref:Tetratricopeptide repeat protein n=1 Tax=Persephonella atlantica TaxID=2699429 RepID=A0ABS1GJK9_9AQUI|nr:hypothetical protein [Persephonella atlantica]MBK3333119.1 tetratricopeptide repeat protein [Persephonella atlantica]